MVKKNDDGTGIQWPGVKKAPGMRTTLRTLFPFYGLKIKLIFFLLL